MKIYTNGQRNKKLERDYEGKFTSFKRRAKEFLRKCLILVVVIGIIIGVFNLGGIMNPSTIVTKAEVIKEVEITAPILERIFKCESGGKHFDKNGQVLMRSNTNRSVDIGVAQINTVWFAKATELGYDLTLEKDNRAMALWIYKNRGTEDWYSSKSCWK